MDSSAIIGDKTKHKNIPNEDGSNLCVCCKRYNLHYSKKYNINASNREAYVAAFNFDVPIGVCCNSCYNKQYRFSKNAGGGSSGTEEDKPKKKRNSRKMSIASSSSSTHSNSENNVDENVNEEENSSNSNHSLKRSPNCSSPDEVVSAKKRKCSLTSLVTTTNTTTTVDQTLAADQPQETTPWNALSTQDDEFLNLLNSIPNNNVKSNNSVETLQIPHQPPQTYSASLQILLADMASNNHNHTSHNIPINTTNQYPDMLVYNQFNRMTSPSKSTTTNQSFVDMVLGQDNQSTNMVLNSMDINQLAMKKMKHSNNDVAQDQLTLSSAHLSNSNTEMVQPFGILDSNNTSTPSIMTSNFSNSGSQMYNLSPSSAPFLSQLFSLPNNNNNGNLQYTYPTITPQYSPKGTAQAAMFIIFFDDSRILTTTDYSYYENSLMTSKFSIHKCCSFSYLCDQLSEKMVNEKKLWNNNMLKSITQIKLKRNGILTPIDPYTTPQLQFEHGDVLLVHLV